MAEEHQARRQTHIDIGASYAAIGASQAEDLLKYPPAESTPFEHECLLGSGENRFMLSSALLMTWGAQLGAGLRVEVVETESDVHYVGVNGSTEEQFFAPDGTPYLQVGSVVRFTDETDFETEMRVLAAVDEPHRVGFVMGTTREQEITGEEFFTIELRDDDTVWAVVRGFYHQGDSGVLGIRSKKRLKKMIAAAREQILALTPVAVATAQHAEPEDN